MKGLATAILLSFVTSGCYTYAPSSIGDLAAGDEIRARLTGAQFDELEEHLPGSDRVLEGEVVETNADGILLEVPVTQMVRGMQVQSLRQRLAIPTQGVTEVELRALNRHRTYAMSGAAALLAGFIVWDQLLADTRRGGTGGGPPPPPEDRRTVVRIPLFVW